MTQPPPPLLRRFWQISLFLLLVSSLGGCQWAEKTLKKVLEATITPPKKPECTQNKDCRAKSLKYCMKGRCVYCRNNKDCAKSHPQQPYCVYNARCVQCVVSEHCALLQRCYGERCQRDKDKEWAMAMVLLLLGLFFPLLQRHTLKESPDMLLKTGIFCLVAGALVGGVAPIYLEFDPWTQWLFFVGGGAMVLAMGLSTIAAYWLDEAGFALGFCGLAWALHYAINSNPGVFGTGPLILKAGVMLFLVLSTGFFVAGLDFKRKETEQKRHLSKVVVTIVGGIFTAIEFVTLLLEFIHRYSNR